MHRSRNFDYDFFSCHYPLFGGLCLLSDVYSHGLGAKFIAVGRVCPPVGQGPDRYPINANLITSRCRRRENLPFLIDLFSFVFILVCFYFLLGFLSPKCSIFPLSGHRIFVSEFKIPSCFHRPIEFACFFDASVYLSWFISTWCSMKM